MKSFVSLVLAGIAGFAPLAQAATFAETSEYSATAASPTTVGAGYDTVSGSLRSGDLDFLALTLGSTASTVTFDFTIANTAFGNNSSFSILYSYSPFVSAWQSNTAEKDQWGNPLGYNVHKSVANGVVGTGTLAGGNWEPTHQSYSIAVDPSLGGTLYLSLIGTGGIGVSNYNIAGFAGTPAEVPAVPLPAGGLLLASAAGAAALWRRRKAA
ncbi:hypothetical protein [Paenirhodobacter sp.]|uniref:hypothetical protein n=1 Tax=Paenirhodobacter sp. TaxID=1965326 RepID=UPI003B3E5F12